MSQQEIDNNDINGVRNDSGDEKEIDLLELATNLWRNRRTVLKWCGIGAIVGLVVAFSIPREYVTTVKLAPETVNSRTGAGGLGALAAMAGFGGMGGGGGADAVYPQLYPDVVSSVPFTVSLFDVKVTDIDEENKYTVAQYIEDETSSPWWSKVLGLPGAVIGMLRGSEEEEKNHKLDQFHLTPKENAVVQAINSRVSASVDAKTSVVTISVKMQDPMVSAILADTVVARLQEYVTDYRTNKARKDLAYAEKLNQEAKQAYYQAQQRYADYLDRNQGLILYSAQTTRDRLENEATLAFNLYNQTSQQLQLAKAKVQETTPVYATVSPATVPIRPASPKKALILVGCVMLAFVMSAAWILFVKPFMAEQKAKKNEKEEV